MSANISNIDLAKMATHGHEPVRCFLHLRPKYPEPCPECEAMKPLIARNVEISNLEDRVVEAAIAWRGCDPDDSARFLAQLTLDVDALIAAREQVGSK